MAESSRARRAPTVSAVGLLAVVVLAVTTAGACHRSTPAALHTESAYHGSADASVTLNGMGEMTLANGQILRSKAVMSLHIDPVAASVNETISATVSYTNRTKKIAVVEAAGGAFYNVRVTNPAGSVVFDSFPYAKNLPLPLAVKTLAPGATMSQVVKFRLREPGRYSAVAYTTVGTEQETPPVTIAVSK